MPSRVLTSPGDDKPGVEAVYAPLTSDAMTADAKTTGAEPVSVVTEIPWFFKAGVAPEGAKARLAAVRAIRDAIAPLVATLQAASKAGAVTPAEAAQRDLLSAWSTRLEVEASILERELAGAGSRAP